MSMKPSTLAPAALAFSTPFTISSVLPVTEEMTTMVPSPTRRLPVVRYSAAFSTKRSRSERSFMWAWAWRQEA